MHIESSIILPAFIHSTFSGVHPAVCFCVRLMDFIIFVFFGKGVDNNSFLDDEQKHRRKELYAKAVKEMSKYGKQVLRDEMEIRQRFIEHKMK